MTNTPAPPRPSAPRRTRTRVHATDALAGAVITLGGIGVIAAVLGICAYLAYAVVPLFSSGRLGTPTEARVTIGTPAGGGGPVVAHVDEYLRLLYAIDAHGRLTAAHVPDGQATLTRSLVPEGRRVSAWSWVAYDELIGLGLDDGSIVLGRLSFDARQLRLDQVSGNASTLAVGASLPHEGTDVPPGSIVERQGPNQFRLISPRIEMREPATLPLGSGSVARIDYRRSGDRESLVVAREDGTVAVQRVLTVTPLGGGRPRTRYQTTQVAFIAPPGRGLPDALSITADGAHVLATWADGLTQRYSQPPAADNEPFQLAQTVELLPQGRRATTTTMMIGGLTLLIGDDMGTLHACFVARKPESGTIDGLTLLRAHSLEISSHPLVSLGVSHRNRSVAVADDRGTVSAWNVTAHKPIATAPTGLDASGPMPIAFAPKFDALLAMARDGSYRLWPLDAAHPEASWTSLFGRVHYEGQAEPSFTYQATAATASAEPKISLVPLIHGTLKATVFAMLFAAPLAVLAAIYTSEFLTPKARNTIKPAVEMMASLPSVVLGFIAAIIVAPFVSDFLSAVLISLVVVPMAVIVAAHFWQMLPPRAAVRLQGGTRTAAIALTLALGAGLAVWLGPIVERTLFVPTRGDVLLQAGLHEPVPREQWPAWVGTRRTMSPDEERLLRLSGLAFRDGAVVRAVEPSSPEQAAQLSAAIDELGLQRPSLRRWLDGNIGTPFPGWVLVLTPVVALLVTGLQARLLGRRFAGMLAGKPRLEAAAWQLGKLAATLAITAVGTLVAAWAVASTGLDTRDLIFGPFNQRNTLVVGIIMGFAVIPIIYTISEDAMSSVPASLRSASLGAGATPWQTAIRVVLPVAGSGIFSAIMIGLGRAVGETMIVVMATGNTASMDWSIFSGFRTLSANIAVELPEAAQNSTHYRVLFLCGLVLFVMTFLINTTAEVVRQRFRRRNAAL